MPTPTQAGSAPERARGRGGAGPASALDAGAAPDRRVRRALDHIEAHLDVALGLDGLAREAGLSRRRFSAVFRGVTGLSAHRWILLRRIERACRLLRTTRRPVVDIAYACGFSSSQHLASAFRAHRRTTPTRYRREAERHGCGSRSIAPPRPAARSRVDR